MIFILPSPAPSSRARPIGTSNPCAVTRIADFKGAAGKALRRWHTLSHQRTTWLAQLGLEDRCSRAVPSSSGIARASARHRRSDRSRATRISDAAMHRLCALGYDRADERCADRCQRCELCARACVLFRVLPTTPALVGIMDRVAIGTEQQRFDVQRVTCTDSSVSRAERRAPLRAAPFLPALAALPRQDRARRRATSHAREGRFSLYRISRGSGRYESAAR